jgi:N-acetylated-alpha-linked acidic dipeptidase
LYRSSLRGRPDLRPNLERLAAAAKQFETDYAGAKGGAREVYLTERALLLPDGLPGRPWYKGAVSAPGRYTGYGAKTIAGVRESLELNQTSQALEQTKVFGAVLDRYAAAIVTAGRRLPR